MPYIQQSSNVSLVRVRFELFCSDYVVIVERVEEFGGSCREAAVYV